MIGNMNCSSAASPTEANRARSSASKCARRPGASRVPRLTIHSLNIDASTTVSRHNTRARFRLFFNQAIDMTVLDEGDGSRRERHQIMIHPVQEEAVQVRHISGWMK